MLSPAVSWALLLVIAILVLWASYAFDHLRHLDLPELQADIREREDHQRDELRAAVDLSLWDQELDG